MHIEAWLALKPRSVSTCLCWIVGSPRITSTHSSMTEKAATPSQFHAGVAGHSGQGIVATNGTRPALNQGASRCERRLSAQ